MMIEKSDGFARLCAVLDELFKEFLWQTFLESAASDCADAQTIPLQTIAWCIVALVNLDLDSILLQSLCQSQTARSRSNDTHPQPVAVHRTSSPCRDRETLQRANAGRH